MTKIIIDIPDNEVPKRREIVEIGLQFMEGEVCECTYPFQVLPKGHGDLIDRNEYFQGSFNDAREFLDKATIIIEADKEANND